MERCPEAKVLVVTNPVDVLTWYMKKTWPQMNVFGLGCCLDTIRFRYFIAEEAEVSVDSVLGIVIGAHDDTMVPLISHATVSGIPIKEILHDDQIARVIARTKRAGTAIVQKLKNHSGYYAASHVTAQIVESIIFSRLEIFPVSVMCNGEYGCSDICLALPSIMGHEGVVKTIEADLEDPEKTSLELCISSMKAVISDLAAQDRYDIS